jgi:hypothetical protein
VRPDPTNLVAALPRDDGSLAQALGALEAKLSGWVAAMRETQALLLRGAKIIAPEPQKLEGAALFVRDGSTPRAASSADEAPRRPPAIKTEPPPATQAVDAEDEALLQSLDPETANFIRVKRRLTGNRRSVRELLEEFQAARGGGKTDGKRKRR